MQELLRNDHKCDATSPPTNRVDMGANFYDDECEGGDPKEVSRLKFETQALFQRKKFFDRLDVSEAKHKPDKQASNLFQCQQITIKSPLWGDIYITKEYFLFASFGLATPEDKVYVQRQEIF